MAVTRATKKAAAVAKGVLGGVSAPKTMLSGGNSGSGGVAGKVTVYAPGKTATVYEKTKTKSTGTRVTKLTSKQAKIAGITVGAIVALVLLVVLFLILRGTLRARRNRKNGVVDPDPEAASGASSDSASDAPNSGDLEKNDKAEHVECGGPYGAGGAARIREYEENAEQENREARMLALETAQAQENEQKERDARVLALETAQAQENEQHAREAQNLPPGSGQSATSPASVIPAAPDQQFASLAATTLPSTASLATEPSATAISEIPSGVHTASGSAFVEMPEDDRPALQSENVTTAQRSNA